MDAAVERNWHNGYVELMWPRRGLCGYIRLLATAFIFQKPCMPLVAALRDAVRLFHMKRKNTSRAHKARISRARLVAGIYVNIVGAA